MKAAIASRFAVFFILLVLGQEFCVALRVAPQGQSLSARETKENDLEVRSRQKRAYAIVLLAFTLSVSAAGLAFEIFNKVKGCCGTYPDACRMAKEIDALRKTIDNKTEEVDKIFLKAKNLKEDVIQANYRIQEMWIDLLAIGRFQNEIIETLSPETVNDFKLKWAEIEQQLKNGNSTVRGWTYTQIDLQFKSYLDRMSTALGGMSSFISNTMSVVYTVAYHYYKVNQLNKMINQLSTGESYRLLVTARHTKAAKTMGLNEVGLNRFIQDTAASRIKSKFATKYTFFYHAYNVVGTLISVGFDIWRAVASVLACKKKRDKVKVLLNKWQDADRGMDRIKIYATHYYNLLKNEGWKGVKGNLSDPNLMKTLTSLKTMISAARPQTAKLTKAVTNIEKFISQINTSIADYNMTYHLQADLVEGLMSVKFFLKCTAARTKLLYLISEECKKGMSSLVDIYARERTRFHVKDGNCTAEVGVSDAVKLQEMENMIAARAKNEKYQKDCVLNNPYNKIRACWLRKDGHDDGVIAKMMNLHLLQVHYLTSDCPLTREDKTRICLFKQMGIPILAFKSSFPHIKLSVIQAVRCPKLSDI